MHRNCAHCGKAFNACSTIAKYCDKTCRHAANRLRKGIRPISDLFDKTCKQCEKPFQAKMVTKKFCSDVCRKKYHESKINQPVQCTPDEQEPVIIKTEEELWIEGVAEDKARIKRASKANRSFIRYLLDSPKHPPRPLPPAPTPREKLAQGVGWRRQRLQLFGRLV